MARVAAPVVWLAAVAALLVPPVEPSGNVCVRDHASEARAGFQIRFSRRVPRPLRGNRSVSSASTRRYATKRHGLGFRFNAEGRGGHRGPLVLGEAF
jgi:hypothetical protein